VKAYADKMGLVEAMNEVVPTERAIDPGTIVLGMLLDTLRGRSPLYRLEEFFTHQDTALLLGKAVAPEALQDATAGRGLDRLSAPGTMKVFTACAVRADRVFGFDKRSVHFDTTSLTVYGESLPPAEAKEQEGPLRIT
jgi:transposase